MFYLFWIMGTIWNVWNILKTRFFDIFGIFLNVLCIMYLFLVTWKHQEMFLTIQNGSEYISVGPPASRTSTWASSSGPWHRPFVCTGVRHPLNTFFCDRSATISHVLSIYAPDNFRKIDTSHKGIMLETF